MIFSEYMINSRPYTQNEGLIENDKNYLFDLSYLSNLTLSGERAAEFLQGQVSCDIRKVTSETIQQGLMCNLQGRVLSIFDVIDWHGLKMVLPKDLLSLTQSALNKTALLSRVQLSMESPYHIYGFCLRNPKDLLPDNIPLPDESLRLTGLGHACCYSLGKGFYLLLINQDQAQTLTQPFTAKQQLRGSLAWHFLQLKQKNIQIYPNTRGLFLPHRLDLHLSGYISFDKGCYKGQEIIARTHYRAKLKHGLRIFTINTTEPLNAGKKLFDRSGKSELGELVDYCPIDGNRYLIAISILNEHPEHILIESHTSPVELCT